MAFGLRRMRSCSNDYLLIISHQFHKRCNHIKTRNYARTQSGDYLIWTNRNSAPIFAWETSDCVWCCKCAVVPLWWVAWRRCVRWISDTGVQPHCQVGCSRISTWSCYYSGSAVPRSTSKPQITSGEGGREVGDLHPTACHSPKPSPGPALYALAASQPALSR